MLSLSEPAVSTELLEIGVGLVAFALDAAVSRRKASKSPLPSRLAVNENTLPRIDHVFLAVPVTSGLNAFIDSKSVTGAPVSCLGEAGNESNPGLKQGCKAGSSVLMIMNRFPGVGKEGAVDGETFPFRSASCFNHR